MEKPKLFVNEFLVAETSPKKQKAIVNRVAGMLEIAFFKPVARNHKIAAQPLVTNWCRQTFPDHESFRRCLLPHSETCRLANFGAPRPRFKNCLTSTKQQDFYGRVRSWDTIDEKGLCRDIPLSSRGNVYAAIIVTEEYFLALNPNINLDDYAFTKKYVSL